MKTKFEKLCKKVSEQLEIEFNVTGRTVRKPDAYEDDGFLHIVSDQATARKTL